MLPITDMTIGIIIIVVAVLDIHIDKKAVANMKPVRILPGLTPVIMSIFMAMRL